MWYFIWALSVIAACSFGIIGVMRYEFRNGQVDSKSEDLVS